MQQRIVWVHGIGMYSAGYSREWRANFNEYLRLTDDSFVEVVWDTVFQAAATRSVDGAAIELTPQEQEAEQVVRDNLETLLLARSSAMQAEAVPLTRGVDDEIREWSPEAELVTTRGAFDWFLNPDAYLGDFTKYLVSPRVRAAVKEKAKEQLRQLIGDAYSITIIAHSWGTVVAYDTLLDLENELPLLQTVNLITLGSPLWMVRPMLQDRSGRKPSKLSRWVNVYARGDLIGSWLHPSFKVDNEFEVPNFGNGGAHSSYFVPQNEAVQRRIVARYVLGG